MFGSLNELRAEDDGTKTQIPLKAVALDSLVSETLERNPELKFYQAELSAAKAGLKAGDVINSMTLPARKPVVPPKGKTSKGAAAPPRPEIITFDDTSPAWVKAFWMLQYTPLEPVSMVVNKASKPIELTAQADPEWFREPTAREPAMWRS